MITIETLRRVFLPLWLTFAFVFIAILLTLFQHVEIGNDTWGYWLFARILSESGEFIIPDRSPIYIEYLQIFRWMGYPNMVTAEYIVTTMITAMILVLFLRPIMDLFHAAFVGVLLWIPYMQISEPPVQNLAFAFVRLGFILRR